MKDSERTLRRQMSELTAAQHARVALACVDRVRPLVDHFYGGRLEVDALRAILQAAMQGEAVDLERAEALRETFEAQVSELYDDDERGYPMNAVKALSSALSHLAPRDWDAHDNAAMYVVEAVDSLAGAAAGDAEMQTLLELVESIAATDPLSPPVTPSEDDEPAWLVRFRERRPGASS